jgi:hypothetical protein
MQEWNGKQVKKHLILSHNLSQWNICDFPTILSIGQCKNGMENKLKKHLILSHNLSEWKIVISLPFYPLENARMEWKTSKKTYDTFSQSISMEHL